MKIIKTLFIVLLLPGIITAKQATEEKYHLKHLINLAGQSNSSSLIVIQDGEVIAEEYFGNEKRLIETMSVTKLIVSIGIGRLYTTGKIESLDQPVFDFYPEWRQGKKREITIRHLLEHTSGLQNAMNAQEEIYTSPDVVQLALAAELSESPGTQVRYNNKAVNLLAGIFEEASGLRMDKYFEREIFSVMGIEKYEWQKDPSGYPYAMSGLKMSGLDVAKFGQLVLNDGVWKGERVISKNYISQMMGEGTGQEFGLLWRKLRSGTVYTLTEGRIEYFEKKGVPDNIVNELKSHAGETYSSRHTVQQILIDIFGSPRVFHEEMVSRGIEHVFESEFEGIAGYYGDGDLGQYLIVLPEKEMAVVRQIEYSDSYDPERDSFNQILDIVTRLDF